MNRIMRNSNEYSGFSNAASEQTFAPGNSGLTSTITEDAIKEVNAKIGGSGLVNIVSMTGSSAGLTVIWKDSNGNHTNTIAWTS